MNHRVAMIIEDPEVEGQLRDRLHARHDRLLVVGASPLHIDEMRDFEPQVILLDTGENGGAVQVRHTLLYDPSLTSVPLVVLAKTADEARALGANAYFTRPFDADALVAVLETLASHHTGLPA